MDNCPHCGKRLDGEEAILCHFADGVAGWRFLKLKRAPKRLVVVVNKLNEIDALDQPEDKPNEDEKCYTYLRQGDIVEHHVKTRERGEWYRSATYLAAEPNKHPSVPPRELNKRKNDISF